MPYGILLVTDDDRIEFANQAFCNMFGLKDSPSDLTDLDANEMIKKIGPSYLNPDQAAARIKEAVSEGVPVIGEDVAMVGNKTLLRDLIPIRIGGSTIWPIMDPCRHHRTEEG